VNAIATPTIKRKNGITKSAIVKPFHGECLSAGIGPPVDMTTKPAPVQPWPPHLEFNGEKPI